MFAPRSLHAIKKHQHLHSLAHVTAYAANPMAEIARCEALLESARKNIEDGLPESARQQLNDIGNILDLHSSVQWVFDKGMVLELFEARD